MKSTFSLKYILVGIIIAMILSTLLTACRTASTTPASATRTPISELQVFNSASYITATSISELTNKSTIVVIGQAVSVGDVINLARDIDDISKPDPNLFGIGQVYEFEVTSYLKGEQDISGVNMIYIVQPEGMIILSDQKPPSKDDIEKAQAKEEYVPIKVGSEYVLFLEPLKGFPELKLHYTGVAHPWRFALVNGCAFPDSPWQGASRYFQPRPIGDFIELVESSHLESSESIESLAYPPPGNGTSSTICLPEPSESTPYP